MKTKKRTSRENALKFFYAQSFGPQENPLSFLSTFELSRDGKNYFVKIVSSSKEKKYLDLIQKNLDNWDLSRLSLIDKFIILIAVIENQELSVKKSIAINEALEISKIYSSKESSSFINGVLDKILN